MRTFTQRGYSPDDIFLVVNSNEVFTKGSIIKLHEDDESESPCFELLYGDCSFNNTRDGRRGGYIDFKYIKRIYRGGNPDIETTVKVVDGNRVVLEMPYDVAVALQTYLRAEGLAFRRARMYMSYNTECGADVYPVQGALADEGIEGERIKQSDVELWDDRWKK